jgi:tetratricopeptide (TPR) repeat protein
MDASMGTRRAALGVIVLSAVLAGAVLLLLPPRPAVLNRAPARVSAVQADVERFLIEGDRRLEARDYRGALETYDRGLQLFPTDLRLLYRAGVALSFLGDREQTTLVFQTVVRRGDPSSPEVQAARAWLQASTAGPSPPAPRGRSAADHPAGSRR